MAGRLSVLDLAWYEFDDLEIAPRGWTADDELEVSELGDRVSMWLTSYLLASIYSGERDRIWAVIGCMTGAVAERTSRRGAEFPAVWLPSISEQGNWVPPWER